MTCNRYQTDITNAIGQRALELIAIRRFAARSANFDDYAAWRELAHTARELVPALAGAEEKPDAVAATREKLAHITAIAKRANDRRKHNIPRMSHAERERLLMKLADERNVPPSVGAPNRVPPVVGSPEWHAYFENLYAMALDTQERGEPMPVAVLEILDDNFGKRLEILDEGNAWNVRQDAAKAGAADAKLRYLDTANKIKATFAR